MYYVARLIYILIKHMVQLVIILRVHNLLLMVRAWMGSRVAVKVLKRQNESLLAQSGAVSLMGGGE